MWLFSKNHFSSKCSLNFNLQTIFQNRAQKANQRLIKVSMVICAAFAVTFLPSVIINLLPGRSCFDVRVHMLASNLSWFNSCFNPIIYAIFNPNFRNAYKIIIYKLVGKEVAKNERGSVRRWNIRSKNLFLFNLIFKKSKVLFTTKDYNKILIINKIK